MKLFTFILLSCMQLAFANDTPFYTVQEPTYPDHSIEILAHPSSEGSSSAIIFLHSAKDTGLHSIDSEYFQYFADKGYGVGAISLPGYGGSSGEKDFCGPFTITSLNLAIDRIKKELGVETFVIMGFGQGGLAAILLSTLRNDIACIVSTNTGYNLLRHTGRGDRLLLTLQKKGYQLDTSSEEDLIARSPLYHIPKISSPLFLLHIEGSCIIKEAEVLEFQQAMLDANKPCELFIKKRTQEKGKQDFSFEEILSETEEWIENFLP